MKSLKSFLTFLNEVRSTNIVNGCEVVDTTHSNDRTLERDVSPEERNHFITHVVKHLVNRPPGYHKKLDGMPDGDEFGVSSKKHGRTMVVNLGTKVTWESDSKKIGPQIRVITVGPKKPNFKLNPGTIPLQIP